MDTKAFYMSSGFWGSAVAVLTPLLALFNIVIDPTQTVDTIMLVVAAAGGVLAMIGRKKATAPLGLKTRTQEPEPWADGER